MYKRVDFEIYSSYVRALNFKISFLLARIPFSYIWLLTATLPF